MKLRLALTPKIALLVLVFGALLVAGVTLASWYSGRGALRDAAESELQATAIQKEGAIEFWIAGREFDIAALVGSSYLLNDLAALADAGANSAEAEAAHERIVSDLQLWSGQNHHFLEIAVLEPVSGEVVASVDPAQEGKFKENRPYFVNGREAPHVQGPYYSLTLQRPAMTAAAPITSRDGRLLGVLIGRLNLKEMNDIITRRTGDKETDDTYLVNALYLFVTQTRLAAGETVFRQGVHTAAVESCLAGGDGITKHLDYRGVAVLSAYRWLPDRDVCLVSEVEVAEALDPSRSFSQTILITGVLGLGVAAVAAIVLGRTIASPVRRLQAGAASIGRGDLDLRLPETSRDELGALAREFNTMADRLKGTFDSLEERVEERTAALASANEQLQAEVTERKRAQEALRESEELFRDYYESAPVAYSSVDTDKRVIVNCNQTAAALLGRTKDEVIGHEVTEFYVPESLERAEAALETFRAEGVLRGVELQVRRKDGTIIDVSLDATAVRDETGRAVRSRTTWHDVTERKQAEEALRQRTHDLGERVKELGCLYGISALVEKPGTSLGEILQGAADLISPAWQYPEITCARVTLDGQGYRTENFRETDWRQASDIVVSGNPAGCVEVYYLGERPESDEGPFLEEERSLIAGIAERLGEATERKRAEEALRESEERFRLIAENAQDVVFRYRLTEPRGFDYVSPAVTALGGYAPKHFYAQPDFDLTLVHPDDRAEFQQMMEERRTNPVELRWLRKDGSIIWMEQLNVPIYDDDGALIAIEGIVRDITDRKRAEEALRESEERTRSVIETALDAYISIDADGVITAWNAQAEIAFGWPPSEAIGGRLADTVIPPSQRDAFQRGLERLRATGEGPVLNKRIEIAACHRNGHEFPVELEIWPTRSGNTNAYHAFIHDITDRKRAEEALTRAREKLGDKVERQLATAEPYGLTFRELTVLHLVAEGKQDREIAQAARY